MSLSMRFIEEYAQAVHPEDDTKQYDLVTRLCTGMLHAPTPEQMQDKIEQFRREYRRTEEWWERFWDQAGDKTWHRPWLATAYANGTKFYDHNPTFSSLSLCGKYGFRVLHLYEGQGVLAYWTDVFDPDVAKISFLTVSCAMSMAVEVTDIIRRWIGDGHVIEPQVED